MNLTVGLIRVYELWWKFLALHVKNDSPVFKKTSEIAKRTIVILHLNSIILECSQLENIKSRKKVGTFYRLKNLF